VPERETEYPRFPDNFLTGPPKDGRMKISHAMAAVCGVAALLTACSGTQAPAPKDVASLATPGSSGQPTSNAPAAGGEQQRPQLRLDSSDAEVQQAWDGYHVCLKQNGHKMLSARQHAGPSGPVDGPDMNDDSPESKAAEDKCKGKLPLQPPEMDAKTNPKYLDDYHEWVKCMNDKGLPVVETDPPGSGWTYNGPSRNTEEQNRKIEHDCQLSAFGSK
jgi:hypothetical protein